MLWRLRAFPDFCEPCLPSPVELTWRLPLAGLVAFSHLQFSQIRGRQPYLIVRRGFSLGCSPVQRLRHTRLGGPYYFRLLNRRRT
jgi:hypothetical protein